MSKERQPPGLSLKLIKWFCKEELVEVLQGDLYQYYHELGETRFRQIRYYFQVLNYLRPSTLKSFKTQNSGSMFIFNPWLAIRNLDRQRSTTVINVFGFTLGLVAAFYLFFYVNAELNVDSFHQDRNQIYRAIRTSDINGDPYEIGITSGPYGPALLNDFPENIQSVNRSLPQDGLVSYGERKFLEDKLLFADPNFFEFFSFPLISGDRSTVLSTPNSVVINQEMAIKYFGDEDPIGKTIKVYDAYPFIVSGIMDNRRVRSHLDFDFVFNIDVFNGFEWFGDWWNNGLITYMKVPTREQADFLKTQFPDFIKKYFPEDFKVGRQPNLTLEPLSEIYFNHETRYDPALHGNINAIYTLVAVGIAILFIACFNYVNLSIAQSFLRAKEVSIRKVLGVRQPRLVLQFLGESILILIFAIGLSIGICELLNPAFNSFFQLEVQLNWFDPVVMGFLATLFVFTLFISGIYPALMLSSFKPVSILRGARNTTGSKTFLRKGLVVAQFSISIFLIVTTLLIRLQHDYLNSKDLGFNQESVIMIDLNNRDIRENSESFKERLLNRTDILSVSALSGEPGGFHDGTILQVEGRNEEFRVRTAFADADYLNTLGVELLAGRNFDMSRANQDSGALMINETALIALGAKPEDVLNRKVNLPSFGFEGRLIGVVKDFHFSSLRDKVEPMIIGRDRWHRRMAVKTSTEDLSGTLLAIEEIYQDLVPNYPLSYDFLDDSLERLYEDEAKQARIFSSFSMISVFLACLGIFGLAAYSAQRRQKELGIRKVLGASINQILGLINKEYMIMVLWATCIAIPTAWYFIHNWLDDYPYRIEVWDHWYAFLIGGVISFIIALSTVTFKTFNAAVSSPTESIRNE